MKDVIISIQGTQFLPDDDDPGTIELVTSGHMDSGSGDYILTYQENTDGEMPTRTTLLVGAGTVTLLRSGDINTQMVFEKGRRHLTYYDTTEGSLLVGILARQVESSLCEQGGRIDMIYDVEIDHALAGENRVTIDVRPSEGTTAPPPKSNGVFYDRYIN